MSDPDDKNRQIFTFGVHGTEETPDQVREATRRISAAVGSTTRGANLLDDGFDWRARDAAADDRDKTPLPGDAHAAHDRAAREVAAARLSAYVLQRIDGAVDAGALDRDRPLTVHLVGFGQGGNVSMLATDAVAAGLAGRGFDPAIHLTTLSTPAYDDRGAEHPLDARDAAQARGATFAHTHFMVPGDGAIRADGGRAAFDGDATRNYTFQHAPFGLDGLANHRAPQTVSPLMDAVAEAMRQRFEGLAHGRGNDDVHVPGIAPAMPDISLDWQAFAVHPMVQQAGAALHRAMPQVPQAYLNPSMIVAVAGVAVENGFSRIEEISFGRDGQTAFITDRDKTDPATRVAPLDMALVGRSTEQLMQRYAPALDEVRTAQIEPRDRESRQQDGPSMA
jgi:hypothetical protein